MKQCIVLIEDVKSIVRYLSNLQYGLWYAEQTNRELLLAFPDYDKVREYKKSGWETFLFEDVFSIDILDLVISFLFGVDISFSLFGVTSLILFFSVLSKSSFSDLTAKFGEVKFDKFVSAEILSESSGRDIFFLIIFFLIIFFTFLSCFFCSIYL